MEESIYRDNLVEISNGSITFFNYYYPSSKNLTVKFNEIEKFEVKEPTLLTGKYRFWGTGNFITWYPKDFKRNTRDHIFFLFRRNKKIRIGFTVENSQQVISILKSKKMIFI
jgi:ABC-type phosphate transport system substrate-binding protein